MTSIPTLDTERLHLRGWRADDLDAFAQIAADPEVMRFLGGPMTRSDAWRTMSNITGHWALRGFGAWALERKSDRALLGWVGIQRPEGWPGVEAVWTLGRPYWKQGYATEAAKASVEWGFRTFPFSQIISLIDAENHASQNVAKRLGHTKGAPTTLTVFGKSFTADIWELPRTRWLSHQ
ncbi:MAG: GNAT family N-acetyltransferase [Longimicrobiales bacterium]